MSWKKPTSKYGMNVFTCGYHGYACPEEFRSAGVKGVLAKQLYAHGWSVVVPNKGASPLSLMFQRWKKVETIEGSIEREFLCPHHNPTREIDKRRESG